MSTDEGSDTGKETMVTCPHCKGTGRNDDESIVRRNGCVFCGGGGLVAPAMAAEYESSEAPTKTSRRPMALDDETIPAPPLEDE